MSTDPTFDENTYASFLTEALELLQTIEQDLLSLKEDHSLNKVHNLMRRTHTLKGWAASVGVETIKQVAHSLEDVFKVLYKPTVVIDSEVEKLLFQAYECLRLLLTAANSTAEIKRETTPAVELTNTSLNEVELLNRADVVFAQLQEKLGEKSCLETPLPTAAELGVDITQSIFEIDVTERLAALADALVQAESNQVEKILRSSATVFVGLAESLNLPGFGAIAAAAIAALDAHPDKAVSIAQIAYKDFQHSVALVLAGDRTRARESSVALQQLATPYSWRDAKFRVSTPLPNASLLMSGNPPMQLAPPHSPTVKVDLERLERLNHLTGDLLTNQNQQGAATEQLQGTVQKLQEQVRHHQQTLSRIRDWSNRMLARPPAQQLSAAQDLEIELDRELYVMLQSAWEETVRLAAATGHVALLNQEYSQNLEKQQQLLTGVRDDLIGARVSPLGDVFSRLERVLQQLVAVYGKPAELQLLGTDVLVDKTIAEKLYDPLLHLVRNAFDHGIESPEVRCQLGKPETGQIRIHAYQRDSSITIEVSDDGKGLDFEKIIERAMEMNLLSLEQAFSLSDEKLLAVLFEPGFSTAARVNELSGRGFGLDVVRSQLELLHGAIAVQSEPQWGTTFTLQIPHTPTTAKLELPVLPRRLKTDPFFVWQTGSTIFILPYTSIEEYLVPTADQIIQVHKQRFLHWHEQMIPLHQLSELLSYNYPLPKLAFGESEVEAVKNVLVLNQGQQLFAIESAIERLITEPELEIQPVGEAIGQSPPNAIAAASYTYGCTVLDDGRLFLVIDATALLKKYL